MTSNWLCFLLGSCIVLLRQGIRAQFVYSNCGLYNTLSSRIVNGRNASPGSAPFMAYLMQNNMFVCGGSIVNNRYILTAAHCVFRNMTVRLGEYDNRSNPDCVAMMCMPRHQDFGIERIGYHKEYSLTTKFNDIALIKLNRNINFNINIRPICLLRYPANAPKVSEYQAFGWGQTQFLAYGAYVLQSTTLNHVPNRQCESVLNISLSRNQICAGSHGSHGSDTCNGDSGGPLVTEITTDDGQSRYLQLGIVSFGHPFCLGIGAYTYTPNYGTWILHAMRKMGQNDL